MSKITVLTHIYYENSYTLFKDKLVALKKNDTQFLFSISAACEQKESLIKNINIDLPNAIVIITPNIGKDIGGKLAMIDLYLRLGLTSKYLIFLHDKMSPHTNLGDTWRSKLFRIIEANEIEKTILLFEQDDELGIVAAKEFINNEYDTTYKSFSCTSAQILKELVRKYKFNLKNHDFIGGTMFWGRAELFKDFFTKYDPLEIRSSLEKGNVLDHIHGTQTHAWERMLSWITTDRGYKIVGI